MLKITLLGTGGTMPLPNRALSALAVSVGGKNILIDCGEGTQTAAKAAGVSLYKIDLICLTHYHGDHIFGLPGLLQTMASHGRTEPVHIMGPEGLEAIMKPILFLCQGLPFAVQWQEMCTTPVGDIEGVNDAKTLLKGECVPQAAGLPVTITAFPLSHRVRCVGYKITLPRVGKFSPEQARALGVPQRSWGVLQKGQSVQVDGQEILPEQVLGAPRKALEVVYATDTQPCKALHKAAKGVDLLICDSTYPEDSQKDKAKEFGHSTFSQVGKLAAAQEVQRLWLTHFSAAVPEPEAFVENARAHYPEAEIGFDGKELELKFVET